MDSPKTSRTNSNGDPKRQEDVFPPKLSWWEKVTLWVSYAALILASLYLVDQLCFLMLTNPSIYVTYVAFGVVLAMLLIDRLVRHRFFVHKARLEDHSEIEALIVEAESVEHRLPEPLKPDNYEEKRGKLQIEVERLKKQVGNRGWTEYQVLSLNQMLVDFRKVDDLIAHANLILAELQEYAEDSAYRYGDQYYHWQQRIEEAIDKINEAIKQEDEGTAKSNKTTRSSVALQTDKEIERDNASEQLRAELRTLLEHVADYQANWSEGSAIVRGLMMCGVAAIPLLLAMGLLPLLHQNGSGTLGILNWGLLGIIGSIAAVLRDLRLSDPVEVGNTVGKKELWRAVLGAALGLLAGVLTYATISGGLLATGSAIPKVDSNLLRDVGLSIIWAVASGFSFERVFGRMLSTTEVGNR